MFARPKPNATGSGSLHWFGCLRLPPPLWGGSGWGIVVEGWTAPSPNPSHKGRGSYLNWGGALIALNIAPKHRWTGAVALVWLPAPPSSFVGRVGVGACREGWIAPSPNPSHRGRGSDRFASTSALVCRGSLLPKHRRIGADAFALIQCRDGCVILCRQHKILRG